jgi:NADPH-dependent glutamate synthase beta subunit-like oxidoreductase
MEIRMPEEHSIAIIGGATAGAEAADIFARQGILTVVFEQNPRPYGKIEDGLPKWHVKLRAKEYETIDRKLDQPHVHLVPNTRIGIDLELRELADRWGFQAVVLANGAWNDRPLPIEGADRFVGKGLYYQNPYILWFNHRHEQGYRGPKYEVVDGTLIVGGGLASIDMAKIVTMELALERLAARGIHEELEELEIRGIPAVLARHGLKWEELGIQGSTIYYRRRTEDMPLMELPSGADEKTTAKVLKARQNMLEKSTSKYLYRVVPLHAPHGLIVENDRLVGLVFVRTRMENGKLVMTDEKVEVRAPLIISSIGSIPQPVGGIPMKGELYAYQDWDRGTLADFPTLFSVGNVVTGKGNIVDSRRHAKEVASYVRDQFFEVAAAVRKLPPLAESQREALLGRVRARQAAVGYAGDYRKWIEANKPPEFI